jgi:4-amino-4-deoxy-L-arabinose transferase-like glycosyltransferase
MPHIETAGPPADQPAYARPALLAIACLAALSYAWGSNNAALDPFYGGAARSMSTSWHDFLFGAFDPAGTVTVDKLPGSLWVQALSLRLLGFHVWALVLPQVVEGVLTILVLYRAVRRLAGPRAGLVAALALAASPVTVALDRGNVSDSLLILLTVLAADATTAALEQASLRWLLVAGLWVGLAFQAKMLQAWLVLPALAAVYLLAAPAPQRRRLGQLALAGAVTAVVSLSWMSAVSLVPSGDRPYVDGTTNDSLFSQVFEYNGLHRAGRGPYAIGAVPSAPFLAKLLDSGAVLGSETELLEPSWHRLLAGPLGRDDGWLLPAALVAAAAALVRRRRAGRGDPLRAAAVLWGTWLLVLAIAFGAGRYLNSYYLAALAPAIAALSGVGFELFWRERRDRRARGWLAATLVACAGYGAYLLHGGTGVPAWLSPLALSLAVCGALAIALAPAVLGGRLLDRAGAAAVVLAALPLSAAASALVVAHQLGPFATPYEPASLTSAASRFSQRATVHQYEDIVSTVHSLYPTPVLLAADTSGLAAPFVYYTGREALPIGGYDGGVPSPTLAQLRHDVSSGRLSVFFVPVEAEDLRSPRLAWIPARCARLEYTARSGAVEFAFYHCPRSSA